MNTGSLKIGLIGCGHWGTHILRNLNDLGVLHSACDISPEKRAAVQKQYPTVDIFEDYRALLDEPSLDAVIVATPASSHFEIARAVLEKDLDVLVEKPVVMSIERCQELIELAENRILMAGHILLYNAASRKLKELLVRLGKIFYIYSRRLDFFPPRQDVGALWDIAVHDISILIYLLDERPMQVRAHRLGFFSRGIEDFISLELAFPSGAVAHVDGSWLFPRKVRELAVMGEKGMAVWDDMARGEYKIELREKWIGPGFGIELRGNMLIGVPDTEPLRLECQHFIDCIKTRDEPLTGKQNILDVTSVLAAAEKSYDSQRWEEIGYERVGNSNPRVQAA